MSHRILIVEDSPTQAVKLQIYLEEAGFDVLYAATAENAVDHLNALPFDAIVSDVNMPGMSGYDLCRQVKARPEWRQTPFVLLTARCAPADIVDGLECGADGFLTKPFEPEHLSKRLEVLIGNRERRRSTDPHSDSVELTLFGKKINLSADKEQLLNVLVSAFEDIQASNRALEVSEAALRAAHTRLEGYASRIELQLDASRGELDIRNQAIDKLNVALVIVDAAQADRPITDISPAFARITGYDANGLIGQPIASLCDTLAPDDRLEDAWRTVERRGFWSGMVECLQAHGTGFWADINILSFGDTTRGTEHLVMMLRDVSERQQLEQHFIQAQKMEAVGQLTGGIAHDFNNMLGVMIGNLELLQDLYPMEGEPREIIQAALSAGSKGADLNRRLLAFARQQKLAPARADINALVAGMQRLIRNSVGEQVHLALELDPAVWPVRVDAGQFESALLNMCINARDAMPRGGTLTVRTGNEHLDEDYVKNWPTLAAGDYAMLTLQDTGTGIAPDIVQRVFEPFFTTKEIGKGSGLGLAMVYGFLKQSGGHVTVYSEPGEGTVFRMYLPRSEEAGAAAEKGAGLLEPPRGQNEIILVVDDNTGLRHTAIRHLKSLGYQTLEAADGRSALHALAHRTDIQLLFTDMVMPGGMNGLELAQVAVARRPGLKVLFCSGFVGEQTGSDTGAMPWPLLEKPYRRLALAEKIRDLLDGAG